MSLLFHNFIFATVENEQERYRDLLERIPGSIYQLRIGPEGEISFPYVSKRLLEKIGVDAGQLKAAPELMLNSFHPEARSVLVGAFLKSAASLEDFALEHRILTKQGVRWVKLRATPCRQRDGSTLWTCIFSDITEENIAPWRLDLLVRRFGSG